MQSADEVHDAELVLVGGGHAHVQLLRSFAMRPPAARLTVIVDDPRAVYSGMVPGVVAGLYAPHEAIIDVGRLARAAGARLILAPATRIDPAGKRVHVAGRPPVRYDVASVNVGSRSPPVPGPGRAVATRPIADLIRRFDPSRPAPSSLAIIGGGAGGVELAFAARARYGADVPITLIEGSERVLPSRSSRASARVRAALKRHRVTVRTGVLVTSVNEHNVEVSPAGTDADATRIDASAVLWAAGAHPPALASASEELAHDARGFLQVDRFLRCEGADGLFAAGDCASLAGAPLPKAGVYAVRQGPTLETNVRLALLGRPLTPYRPQRDFLTLIGTGDGSAIALKWGWVAEGRWVWRLKDRIDRRFVQRFTLVDPPSDIAAIEGADPMACGGCAAKLGATELERALASLPEPPEGLASDLARGDDAAIVSAPTSAEDAPQHVVSVDGFRAFDDDAFLVGEVAAVNAVSDIYAMGAQPRYAVAAVTVPSEGPLARREETLAHAMAGIRRVLDDAQVGLVGGHTTVGPELFVALTVEGTLAAGTTALTKAGLLVGQQLILTKALGTGVLLAADMRGYVSAHELLALREHLSSTNREAAKIARHAHATGLTDVTGFGFVGHALEMAAASSVGLSVSLSAVPLLPGAQRLSDRGMRSTLYQDNVRQLRAVSVLPEAQADPRLPLLVDPQTAGGLLFGVDPSAVTPCLQALQSAGVTCAVVGDVTEDAHLPLTLTP